MAEINKKHFQTFFVDFRREITEKGSKLTKKLENAEKSSLTSSQALHCKLQALVAIHTNREPPMLEANIEKHSKLKLKIKAKFNIYLFLFIFIFF